MYKDVLCNKAIPSFCDSIMFMYAVLGMGINQPEVSDKDSAVYGYVLSYQLILNWERLLVSTLRKATGCAEFMITYESIIWGSKRTKYQAMMPPQSWAKRVHFSRPVTNINMLHMRPSVWSQQVLSLFLPNWEVTNV